jgi:hypothetical protein
MTRNATTATLGPETAVMKTVESNHPRFAEMVA